MVSNGYSKNSYGCHLYLYKFDLKVKSQRRIGIMNVRDILPYGDTPMCQIWYANVKPKKGYGLYTKACQKPY